MQCVSPIVVGIVSAGKAGFYLKEEGKSMPSSDITIRDIYLARKRIAGMVRRTPLVTSSLLTECVGAAVYLKLESLQETGAFKIRGALNKIFSLTEDEKAAGVITASSGNHGRGVAYAARKLGIHAVICLSTRAPKTKVEAIRRLGAEVVVYGKGYDDAAEYTSRLQKERGLTLIHGFDDPFVIAGAGTIGLELLEDLPEIDTAIVPLSGGGALSGIALALKSADPAIRVIGVTMDRAPVMYHSLRAGKPMEMKEEETIADALAGGLFGLTPVNHYTFRMCQQYVDETVLVSEEEIAEAMTFTLEQHHLVVEGAGAVGIAAVLHQRTSKIGQNVVVVVTGGNVDLPLLLKVARSHSGKEADLHPI